VRVATTAKTSPNIKVELENLGLPHTTSPSELAVLRTAKGWEPWVLELTAKQRNRLILKLQLSDEETCSLKAAASRHKQRDSQRRYAARRRAASRLADVTHNATASSVKELAALPAASAATAPALASDAAPAGADC